MALDSADNDLRHSKPNVRKGAEHWMSKGGLVRDDSDDELGYDDLPWEWVFEEDTDTGNADGVNGDGGGLSRRPSRRGSKRRRRIVGARMGTFECKLGQAVLLSSPEPGKDWVGIITDFLEEEDEESEDNEVVKSANIMWFASPDEFMSTRNKRRADALPNEQYITADFNVNPLTSISGKASVMSKDVFFSKYPNGPPRKGKEAVAEYNKCIICRRGVNQVQGRYTEEFVWEDVYQEDNIFDLIDMIKNGLKAEAAKKRKKVDSDVSNLCFGQVVDADYANQYVDQKDDDVLPTTPRKKQKMASTGGTPDARRAKTLTTPSKKRYGPR